MLALATLLSRLVCVGLLVKVDVVGLVVGGDELNPDGEDLLDEVDGVECVAGVDGLELNPEGVDLGELGLWLGIDGADGLLENPELEERELPLEKPEPELREPELLEPLNPLLDERLPPLLDPPLAIASIGSTRANATANTRNFLNILKSPLNKLNFVLKLPITNIG